MKTLILKIAMLSSMTIFAQQPPPQIPAKNLGAVMKAMSSQLKKLSVQVADPKLNADSVKITTEMIAQTLESKNFTPKKIEKLPPDQLKIQKEKFDLMIDELVVILESLKLSLEKNDNAKAADVLTQIAGARKEGHNTFK